VRKEAARALGGAALRARGLSKGLKLGIQGNLLNGREKLEWASLGFNTETESIVKVMVNGRLRDGEGEMVELERSEGYEGEKGVKKAMRFIVMAMENEIGAKVFVKCPKPPTTQDAKEGIVDS